MRGLDPDTTITQSLPVYGEPGIISHGVEHGNDFTDRVLTRIDRYLLVVRVHHHIAYIHVVEHNLIGSKPDSDGS